MIAHVIGTILLIIGLALAVVGVMGWLGKLPGNPVVGIRVQEVRKSKQVWDAAHKVAGPLWLFSGVVFIFAALFAFIATGWLWLAPVALIIIALIAAALGGSHGAHLAARLDVEEMVREQNPEPAPAPKVDMDALRRAARHNDNED